METRLWLFYTIVNCVLIQHMETKTFSLNEVIAAESQQKEALEPALPPKLSARTSKRKSLFKRLSSTSKVKRFLETTLFQDNTTTGGRKISPLKYKKTFQIKSPLKPKRLKLIQKHRRRNQSVKREINGNENFKQKYIPLLKSLSMLFDNLLDSDASESHEVKAKKFKRNRFYSGEIFDKFDSKNAEYVSQETTITSSPPLTVANSFTTENITFIETTTKAANYITPSDFSAFRQNKDIPLLLPRDSFSSRRNDNGISERSGTTLYRNFERNFTGHYGDHEHTTKFGENESRTEYDKKNTNSLARDGAGSFRSSGSGRGIRNNTRILPKNVSIEENNSPENDTSDDSIREIQLETGRDKAKSARVLQESFRRLRGFISEDVAQNSGLVQPKEESIFSVPHNNTSNKRIVDGGGSLATKDKKVSKGNETVTLTAVSSNSSNSHLKMPQKKSPVVMIFDGYSVTRHKNGENKFAEKSVRIHS